MNKKCIYTAFITIITSAWLASCSSQYVSSNLDKANFSDYFSASNVTIYENEKDINGRYKFLGSVEGQDCQIKAHHATPDIINARTQARQQAFHQNANAIVFTGCATLTPEQLAQLSRSNDAMQCHAIVICYGKAYVVDTSNDSQ